MEEFDKFKNPGLDRVLGRGINEESLKNRQAMSIILGNQEMESFERAKTPEEKQLVQDILDRIPEFVKEYGLETPKLTIPAQVHILDNSNPETEEIKGFLERNMTGAYVPKLGRIEILLAADENMFNLGHILAHELMHANSFESIVVNLTGKNIKNQLPIYERRFGFSISRGMSEEEKRFFEYMNEAITEELALRFSERYFMDIEITRDSFLAYKKKIKEDTGKDDNANTTEISVIGRILEVTRDNPLYSYKAERVEFAVLMKDLWEKNRDRFPSYEDVFKMFSKAMFTGKILEVARLIEKTYGKGSFREMGELTKNPAGDVVKKFEKFINERIEKANNPNG
jgi:hypothetical protein